MDTNHAGQNFDNKIKSVIQESIKVKDSLGQQIKSISSIANLMIEQYQLGKKVIWFGNGGSASDSQHLACELVSRFYLERPALRSIALTTDTSILTAISNDYDFSQIFSRQVEALVDPGDVVIGISTSGNSLNVIKGITKAKEIGAVSVSFTGRDGGELKNISDYIIRIPSDDVPRIQECHIMIGHILCLLVEETMANTLH